MCADDAAIFLTPTMRDVSNLTNLLLHFGRATGHCTNMQKTSVTPISCGNINLEAVLSNLSVSRPNFPIKYLGLPLTTRRLVRLDFQPLVDKAANKLSTWNGRNQAGRVSLTKSVLSSQPIYLLSALKPPKETIVDLDRLRKGFIWACDRELTGGKCKVKWTRTTLPKEHGGLGVLNLDRFARALRLRWLWHQWVSPQKPWVGTKVPCDNTDHLLFTTCTKIHIGDGTKTRFWTDAWVQGRRPKDIAPGLFKCTQNKRKTAAEALQNNNWIRDLNYRYGFTVNLLHEYFTLWQLVRDIRLQHAQQDTILWKLTQKGKYTTTSAYKAQFLGCTREPILETISGAWAPPKCKFFAWLYKTESGLQTDYNDEVGTTSQRALYAGATWKSHTTWLRHVDSPEESGTRWPLGN